MKINKKYLPVVIFFIVLSGLWIFPAILSLNEVLFHPRAEYSDILISHWPNMQFFHDAWQTWGELPLWNPLILSGAPLVGDPLFGIWYPPNWLALLFPGPLAINILLWAHLAWAGLGMFQWLKSENIGWGGALIAGIAFSGTPKLIGHVGLGHLGLVSAVSWTPWLLWVIKGIVRSSCSPGERTIRWHSLGSAIAAMLFLADIRWIVPAMGLALLYALRTRWKESTGKFEVSITRIGEILVSLFLFFGLISGLALPLVEFTANSTRSNISFDGATDLSLPVNNILGLIIPNYGGWPETLTYLGLFVLGLALVAILGKGDGWLFWLSIGIAFLLLALGNNTPLYKLLFNVLPGFRYLRVPARFFYICSLSAAVLAGIGFDILVEGKLTSTQIKRIRLGIVGFGGLIFLMSLGALILLKAGDDAIVFPWKHMILAAILFLGIGFLSLGRTLQPKYIIALASVVLALDLFIMNQSLLEIRTEEEKFSGIDIIQAISTQITEPQRIFSPTYSVPQNIAAKANLQLADGVNPLQLRSYWEFMAGAIGFEKEEYSVTLPPFPQGETDQLIYTDPDIYALGLLNVSTIVSAYPLDIAGLKEVSVAEGLSIYRNSEFRPRAWIEGISEGKYSDWREIESMEWSPNQIIIEAKGQGKLVLSELNYPGWIAKINGERVEISSYNGLLRSVRLEAAKSVVEFQYRPWTVYIGAGLTFFTLLLFAVIWWRK